MKILFLIIVYQVLGQSCLNGLGRDVDWWFILKMPKISSYDGANHLNGYEYLYCDSINNCNDMELVSSPTIKDPNSPLMRTVAQISFTSTTTMTVVWNDQQFLKQSVSIKAHSKGMLSASLNNQGFIINHSLPQFPIITRAGKIKMDMHTNAEVFGQHFFCVTMDTKEIDKVAQLFWNAQIVVQESNNILAFQSQHPNIYKLQATNRRPVIAAETLDHLQVLSKAGLQLEMIAKPQRLKKDFYQYVVAEKLKTGLIMETWGLGIHQLQEAMCLPTNKFEILSNEERLEQAYFNISYKKDHSKYGISLDSTKKYVCVSDINRQLSQLKRGGTAICFIHNDLWDQINLSFVRRQAC